MLFVHKLKIPNLVTFNQRVLILPIVPNNVENKHFKFIKFFIMVVSDDIINIIIIIFFLSEKSLEVMKIFHLNNLGIHVIFYIQKNCSWTMNNDKN